MNKKVVKILIIIALVLVIVFALSLFKSKKNSSFEYTTGSHGEKVQQRLKIAVSFYPLFEFTKQVVGDLADVINVSGQGVSPHDFEPTPKDIAGLYDADVFIFNGAGLDPWAEKVKDDLEGNGVLVLDIADLLELENEESGNIEANKTCKNDSDCEAQQVNETNEQVLIEEIEMTESENVSEHNNIDPHFWVDPVIARQEVKIIKENLQFIDAENFDLYEKNADEYRDKLKELDDDFEGGLKNCVDRTMVTSHEAFDYLAKRYNIESYSIAGFSPNEEPSSKKLADLTRIVREKKIKYIFFETLTSPKLSQTLAQETGAETLTFNPVAGLAEDEVKLNKDYISIMRENLNNLKTAMQCQ